MGGGGVRPAILEFFPIRCLFLGFGGVRWQEEFGWMSRVGFIIWSSGATIGRIYFIRVWGPRTISCVAGSGQGEVTVHASSWAVQQSRNRNIAGLTPAVLSLFKIW